MKVPWLKSLSPRWRRIAFWSVVAVVVYTVTGFFIAPPIVRSIAIKQISQQLDREVFIGKVKLNPYVMSATIRALVISDKDKKPFISWDEVYVNFQLYSIFTKTYVFKEVRTTHPYMRVQVNPDRSLNFSDILEKVTREAAAKANDARPAKPISVRVDEIQISAARLAATDLTTKRPFSKFIGPLELTLRNFATSPDNKNPYSFTGSTEEGEKFSWSGHFFLDPIRSIGEFTLENISLAKYAPVYEDMVRFDIREGTVDVRASYEVAYRASGSVARLTNSSVAVKSLKVAEMGAKDNALEVGQFTMAGISGDGFGRVAEIRLITTSDGRIGLRRNADASINLIELSKPGADATNVAGSVAVMLRSVTNVVDWLLRTTNAWMGKLHEISVTNYAVQLEDLATARPVRIDMDNISLNMERVSNVPGSNIVATASMRWNTNGTIRTEVEFSLFPLKADVKLGLENLEIRALDPYLDPFLNLLVTKGYVNMDARVKASRVAGRLPDVSFQAEVRVKDFAAIDGLMTEDFIKCKELRVTGLEAQSQPLGVSIKEVALEDASARLVIDSEKTNNLFAVLRRTSEPEAVSGDRKAAGPKKSGRLPRVELPTNLVASARGLPKISIDAVVFTNAQLTYLDRSLKPPVAVAVAQVNGSISGLSSEDISRADIHLTGKVDNTAPMEITGKINPLSTNGFTDVKVAFHGIEMIPTSPYAGKYLGYRLSKGKVSLDVHYHLADNKLKGENLITIDQLMLGEKVESPDATKLPVRLGIAILKDRSGKIELDVPVEGNLNDPEFRLGRVITRAIVNVFTKIVTSPFAALGALFGGKGEEVSYQDFAPGSAELTDANKQKLDLVVNGLFERPGLQLEIEGAVDPATDRDALRRQKLRKEFRTKKWMALRKAEQSRLTPEQVELTEAEYQEYLKEAYAAAFSAEAVAARSPRAATDGASPSAEPKGPPRGTATVRSAPGEGVVKGATALVRGISGREPAPPSQDMESQLMALVEISENDFALLAGERAGHVKEYILSTGKVEAERVFLAGKADNATTTKGSRAYLHLR